MTTPFRRILHATDFSRASGPAFAAALALAREAGASLRLVHVVPPRGPAVGKDYMALETYHAVARREAETGLAAMVARAARAGVRAQSVLVEGVPATEIVREARKSRANVIVLGTHGRGGFSRFFVGSVAQRVLQFAPCMVLTVRSR
jgi:nucleotide-binding universal stress UspA family protein